LIVHYPENDPECTTDYVSVQLYWRNGTPIRSWGDAYHDDGLCKAEAFLQGIQWAYQHLHDIRVEVEREDVPDMPAY
jgi:hypothetical protein